MKKIQNTTISIDTETSTIHCYSILGNDEESIAHQVKNYSGAPFDAPFYRVFRDAITEFVKNNPSKAIGKITLVLPDSVVALDTVNVPTMRSAGATKKALSHALAEIYRNLSDLKVQSFASAQNRQYTTFGTAMVQNQILTHLYSICSENHLMAETTTYAAGATVAALSMLDPKLKNESYLFLDIKETYSRFVFVVSGRVVGFFHLPFGLDFLTRPRYVQEDILFDHTMAELTVLNAREKAKARKLSILADENTARYFAANLGENQAAAETTETVEAVEAVELTDTSEGADDTDDADAALDSDWDDQPDTEDGIETVTMTQEARISTPKFMPKKTPRKLPKFMQRQVPETVEGIARENFRVLAKWALSLLAENERLTALGTPEFVCVNLPWKFVYVLDAINDEREESDMEFRRLNADDRSREILSHLELYGGCFPKMIHRINKF